MNYLPSPLINSARQFIIVLIVTGYVHTAQSDPKDNSDKESELMCENASLELEASPTVLPIAKEYLENFCQDLLVLRDWSDTETKKALAKIKNSHDPLEEFMRIPKKNRTKEQLIIIKKIISQRQESHSKMELEYKQMIKLITKSLTKLMAVVGTQVTYCENELKKAGIWVDEFNLFSSSGEKFIEKLGMVSEDNLQNTYSLASMATTYQLKKMPADYCSSWTKADTSNALNQFSFFSMLQNIK